MINVHVDKNTVDMMINTRNYDQLDEQDGEEKREIVSIARRSFIREEGPQDEYLQ